MARLPGALDDLRTAALGAARAHAEAALAAPDFVPGRTPVPVAGKILVSADIAALVDAALDGWLTEGRHATRFAADFARVVGRESVALVGSGSQANLLAITAATSHLHERPLQPGDEVITPAVGFPTTANPIFQNGLIPVFVD